VRFSTKTAIFESVLLVIMIGIATYLLLASAERVHEYTAMVEKLHEAPPPTGKIYRTYCDGRPSHYLVDRADPEACFADYPGTLDGPIIIFGLVTVFLGLNLLYFAYFGFRRLLRNYRRRHIQ